MSALILAVLLAAAPAVLVADSAVLGAAAAAGQAAIPDERAGLTGASQPTFVPSLALGLGRTPETLTLDLDQGRQQTERSLWHADLALGLGYDLTALGPGRLRGHTALGLAVVLEDARRPLGLTQQFLWEHTLGRSVRAAAGAHAAVVMELETPARAHLDLGLPLGLRWRALELLYVPSLGVPLGAAERAVFGGKRAHRTGTGLALVQLALRIHVDAAGW